MTYIYSGDTQIVPFHVEYRDYLIVYYLNNYHRHSECCVLFGINCNAFALHRCHKERLSAVDKWLSCAGSDPFPYNNKSIGILLRPEELPRLVQAAVLILHSDTWYVNFRYHFHFWHYVNFCVSKPYNLPVLAIVLPIKIFISNWKRC